MLPQHKLLRGAAGFLGAGLFFCTATAVLANTEQQEERHFLVKEHPVVIIDNIVSGRIK